MRRAQHAIRNRRVRNNVKRKPKDLNASLSARLAKAGIPHYKEPIYRASVKSFTKAIRRAQLANSNGWMVDAHTKEKYKGMKLYLSRDGKVGVAIKKDGNVTSLFSMAGRGSNAMGSLIPFAVAHGARKLDAFAAKGKTNLPSMYARFGARATGRMEFNPEYAPNLWKMKDEAFKNDPANHPDVVAMTLPKSLNSLIRRYNRDASVNVGRLKTFDDYDEMRNDRDRKLSGVNGGLAAAFGTRG